MHEKEEIENKKTLEEVISISFNPCCPCTVNELFQANYRGNEVEYVLNK